MPAFVCSGVNIGQLTLSAGVVKVRHKSAEGNYYYGSVTLIY